MAIYDAEIRKRIEAAYTLLTQPTTSRQKFDAIQTLLKGINTHLDQLLTNCSKTWIEMEKLHRGEVITLTAEHLPERTEEEKKRKRALLLFINNWKLLKSEVERLKGELKETQTDTSVERVTRFGKIVTTAKDPFGLMTLVALVVAGVLLLNQRNTSSQLVPPVNPVPETPRRRIKVISFEGKRIPLSELRTGIGPECLSDATQAPHYHALSNEIVQTLDGSSVTDPGGCGFGKVDETEVVEAELN